MQVEVNNNQATILVDELFDFKMLDDFREAYESIPAGKVEKITVNLSATKYMDSSALGMLLNLQQHFSGNGVSIALCHASEQIRKVLTISRFDRRFDIVE